jgi:hypothetical protein
MLDRDTARGVARSLAIGRIAIGLFGLVLPDPLCRLWAGADGDGPGMAMFGRIVGGREIALGLGAVLAVSHDGPVRGWMEAASLADAVDSVVTASRFGSLPRVGRWLFLLGAAGAAVTEAVLARAVDG